MKNVITLSILLLLIISVSCEKEVKNGKNSLMSFIVEPGGTNCSSGGFKINSGIDLNENNVLDEAEIQNTEYICNGESGTNGYNTLMNAIPEQAGDSCSSGGYRIVSGFDLNENNILDNNEILNTKYVCNGTDGENGFNSLVGVVPISPGTICSLGGYKIISGFDQNSNNSLDEDEVQNTTYICSGDTAIVQGVTSVNLTGNVQKGPYLNGTAITVSELTTSLAPTGRNFTTQIVDNKGTFEIKNVEFESRYVELKADGFYFNEIKDGNSTAQLTLFALTDLTDKSSLNVNVLSHLEKGRVGYLVSGGMSFQNAKKQAQEEILQVFSIEQEDMPESEMLDISKDGEGNAILLAISAILQGYSSEAELSELMANMNTDIREDGILNSSTLGSKLINHAQLLNVEDIRENLEDRYEELGVDATIPDFETYIQQFINNTEYEYTAIIEYPATGNQGTNILDKEITELAPGEYSMKAILPEGTSLSVKISGNNWFFRTFQQNTGWDYTDWNDIEKSRIFTSNRTGEVDFAIRLEDDMYGQASNITSIDVYEQGATEPTWSKEITVTNNLHGITYSLEAEYGSNILAMDDTYWLDDTSTYSLTAEFPEEPELYVKLKINRLDGNVSWTVDLSVLDYWDGIPYDGGEIKLFGPGETIGVPIDFIGEGKIEVQIETFVDEQDVYLSTRKVVVEII